MALLQKFLSLPAHIVSISPLNTPPLPRARVWFRRPSPLNTTFRPQSSRDIEQQRSAGSCRQSTGSTINIPIQKSKTQLIRHHFIPEKNKAKGRRQRRRREGLIIRRVIGTTNTIRSKPSPRVDRTPTYISGYYSSPRRGRGRVLDIF